MRKVWDSKAFKAALLIAAAPIALLGAYQPSAVFTPGFGLNLLSGVLSFNTGNTAPVGAGCDDPLNVGLAASVSADALTIKLKQFDAATDATAAAPIPVCFDAAVSAVSSGPVWTNVSTALSITIPQNATLGTVSGNPARVWVFLTYNGGAPELAVATCSALVSSAAQLYACKSWTAFGKTTTTIGAGSLSPGVPYATTGVSGDRLKIIGYIEATEATAGQWATAPSIAAIMGRSTPMPGDVISIQYSTISVSTAVTSTGYSSYGPTVTFTMQSPTNAVEVWSTIGELSNQGVSLFASLYSAARATQIGNSVLLAGQSGGNFEVVFSLWGLDLPGTSASVSYLLNAKCTTSTGCFLNFSSLINIIEAKEIMG